ncbi:MAG: hypothetical protein R2771_00850 [Saprospiraceae bacterium]
MDNSGEIDNIVHICPECRRPLYTNQILDYFPSFLIKQKMKLFSRKNGLVGTEDW